MSRPARLALRNGDSTMPTLIEATLPTSGPEAPRRLLMILGPLGLAALMLPAEIGMALALIASLAFGMGLAGLRRHGALGLPDAIED